ncbi:MAG TPA: DNA-formamidopyrimidine glycosylase family protein [Propionicimonas sp.]|nr:DNA-formamidopyrimidine glycosylase family protein [Propionicimonas sp.]
MPEGDTVKRTCDRLHAALAGRVLTAAELRWPTLSTANLVGMTVVGVVPYGKHILIRFDSGWTLHSHLRMEGQWRIEHSGPMPGSGPTSDPPALQRQPGPPQRQPGPPQRQPGPPQRHPGEGRDLPPRSVELRAGAVGGRDLRALLANSEWTALGLRLGELDLVRTAEEGQLIGRLGPDILADDFALATAVANVAQSGTTIGAALLDQRNLAGIGTLWASEALFLVRLHPWRPAAEFTSSGLAVVIERARRLMLAALPHAVQSTTGSRRPNENTYVHGRSGRPCRRCGATVRVAMIGPPTRERTVFYCPGCQGGLAPTDGGRSIAPLGSGSRDQRPRGAPDGKPRTSRK